MDEINIKARAKINLALDVTGKRADGYHEVRMIMQSIDLFDELTFSEASKDHSHCGRVCRRKFGRGRCDLRGEQTLRPWNDGG